jgi:SAM-dependent methyltransferase
MSTCDEWSGSVDWYAENMGEEGDALNRELIRPIVLQMLGDTGDRLVVDCGCGSGYLTAELARRSRRVVGLDFSPGFVALCRRKYAAAPNLEFLQHDVTRPLPFDQEAVDAVLCKMVLQYVPEIATFAAESWRVLQPGGTLVVVVDHPLFKLAERGDYFDGRPRTKLSLWGRVELTWYPRTLADYVGTFLGHGFRLVGLIEVPKEEEDGGRVPRILALHLSK